MKTILKRFFSSGKKINNIDSHQAFELLQNEKIYLVDIRTKTELKNTGIAKNALFFDVAENGLDSLKIKIDQLQKDSKKSIYLICKMGGRSGYAVDQLTHQGVENIYNVNDGMEGNPITGFGWIANGYPTEFREEFLEN